MAINLPRELKDHQDEWVALTQDYRIGGFGKTPEEALVAAAAAGERDTTLFFAAKCLFDGSTLVL